MHFLTATATTGNFYTENEWLEDNFRNTVRIGHSTNNFSSYYNIQFLVLANPGLAGNYYCNIAQWAILAIFGSLQNPHFIQILGPKMLICLILTQFLVFFSNNANFFK